MERKKRAARKPTKHRGATSRKRVKLSLERIRINLILCAAIFGISACIFFIRFGSWDSSKPETGQSHVSTTVTSPEKTPITTETPPVNEPAVTPTSAVPDASGIPAPGREDSIDLMVDTAVPRAASPALSEKPPAPEKTPVSKPAPVKPAVTKKPSASVEKRPGGKSPPRMPEISRNQVAVASPPPERPYPIKHKGTLIFVFDDAGHNLKQLEPFLKLPFPCTIAVLPGLEYSGEAARRVRAAGKEIILHQPMQAINLSMDPGPGAIKQGMTVDQVKTIVRRNLAEVGPVSGLNNHEGSLITADKAMMGAILAVARERGIYFLDSRTNAATQAPAVARETKMTIWERSVFLDNAQDRASIEEAVSSGMKIAERKGAAIMIGHIWSADLAGILNEMYPELVSQGYSLSTIARIAIDKDEDE